MARPISAATDSDARLAELAGDVVARAQRRLTVLVEHEADFAHMVSAVELAVHGLDDLSRRAECPDRANRWIVDWRDRLGSYLHAARALTDVRIDTDVARHLLQRGVDEISAAIALTRWDDALARG